MKKLSIFILIGLLALSFASFAKDVPDAIGIWTFDSIKGDQVLDISGKNQHGTILAGGEITKGKIGNGIKLNGSNQCVEVPHSDVLDVADDKITMMCWFNWGGAGDGWQTFFSKGPMSGTNENWALFINTGAGYFHFITTPNGARVNVDSPGGVVKKNEWQFVAGTYDGKMIRIYLDGEKIKEQALSGKLTTNKNNLRLGHREGSPHWWTGMLDEMAAFHRALDEKEIEQIRKEGFQKFMAVEAETKLPTVWGRIKSR